MPDPVTGKAGGTQLAAGLPGPSAGNEHGSDLARRAGVRGAFVAGVLFLIAAMLSALWSWSSPHASGDVARLLALLSVAGGLGAVLLGAVRLRRRLLVPLEALEKSLVAGGHFFVECVHNCKHAEPPVTPLKGQSRYESIWAFAFKHPFWLPAGQSPLQVSGAPPSASYFAAAASASRAWPTRASKAAGSLTASSARILRSRSISAFFRPLINCE